MQTLDLIAALVPSVLLIVGLIYGFGKWSGKIEQNTLATEKLSQSFENHAEKISEKVEDHEVRIRILEGK